MSVQRLVLSTAGLVLIAGTVFVVPAQAAAVREQFKASVAELQKNPGNKALREKVIKLALKLKPKPVVPKEARRRMARGRAAVKAAKNEAGYQKAITEFQKATAAAPWLAKAYYNLGIVQDKAGDYAGAMKSLQLYLLAAPKAKNAEAVEARIYEIEFRQEEASKGAKKPKGFEGQWDYKRNGELMPYMTVTKGSDGKLKGRFDMPGRSINNFSVNATGKSAKLDFEELTFRYDPPRMIEFRAGGRVVLTYEDRAGWRLLCGLELDGAMLDCNGFPIEKGQFDASGNNDIQKNLYRRKN